LAPYFQKLNIIKIVLALLERVLEFLIRFENSSGLEQVNQWIFSENNGCERFFAPRDFFSLVLIISSLSHFGLPGTLYARESAIRVKARRVSLTCYSSFHLDTLCSNGKPQR